MEPTAIVGDIHGDAQRAKKVLTRLRALNRRAIFVGDYINRGRGSRQVLDLLVEHQESGLGSTFLRGNHETALTRWIDGGTPDQFIKHGGLSTVKSYTNDRAPGALDRFLVNLPNEHLKFLDSLALYHDEPGLFVSHGGFDPLDPGDRTEDALLYGSSLPSMLAVAPASRPQQNVVFGHHVQTSVNPFIAEGLFGVDTGCGTLENGRLTLLLLPEKRFEQF